MSNDMKPDSEWAMYESIRNDLCCTNANANAMNATANAVAAAAMAKKQKHAANQNSNNSDSLSSIIDCFCNFCESLGLQNEIVLEEGNYCCKGCHSIVSRHIDQSAEWRYYGCDDNKGSDPTRCGMPTSELLPESSLGSMIGYAYNESYDVRLMRKYQQWNSMTYRERSLYNIFDSLTTSAVNNGISKSIIEEAKALYKKVSEARISRGDNRSGLIASSIYISCKNNKVPRSCKEIAKIFNLKSTTMTRGCKKFAEIMKLNMDATTADDFISRFCSKMGLDNEKKEICKHVIRRTDELSIVSENTPPSVAAGTIYLCSMVCGWEISKKDLSESCDISQVTVNKCYKKMLAYQKLLLP
jgi:transcription initiation factor TFIIB